MTEHAEERFAEAFDRLFTDGSLHFSESAALRAGMAAAEANPAPAFARPGMTVEDWQAVRAQLAHFKDPETLNADTRRLIADVAARAQTRTIEGPCGALSLRIVLPKGDIKGAYFHTHGGGWCLGTPRMFDERLGRLADQAGLAVASVDYRLAPEHPYPAACDDCEAAALWWIEEARKAYGAETILIGGESAGGHLAMVTLLRLRNKHGYRFAGANLEFGLYDFSNGLPSRTVVDGRPFQDSGACIAYADAFVPGAALRRHPDVSPLYAHIGTVPPALFTVGTLDSFRDDSLLLWARWRMAGNKGYLVTYQGAAHGFERIACPETDFQAAVPVAFARRVIAGAL